MLRLLLASVLLPGATALLLPGVRHASAVQRCTAPRACDGLPDFVVELEEPMLDEEITAPAEEVTAAAPPAAPDPPAPSMAGSTIAAVPDGEWIISEENGVHSLEVGVAGKTMHFESGLMAKLSSGAVSLQVGATNVFCAATFERKDDPDPIDFTPLRVDYFERSSSVGRTKGGANPSPSPNPNRSPSPSPNPDRSPNPNPDQAATSSATAGRRRTRPWSRG